ncbi:RNA-guided pseudouridylation complex pseudouridine synthase subunit Cbf5 [Candidatus Woesearchaeota archaeon]|nr:RNA-guided pseudouridylation complex pseudouridine synthase subunit Cbf5 [Candidatus Woesearchaeota archaeon]
MLPFEKRKPGILTKKESVTSSKFGCYPEERSVEKLIHYGIVNLDKPSGPTSHQVSAYVQKILAIEKAGHSGTLDPRVTGVLPVALDKATRIVNSLLKAGKEYIALIQFHKPVTEKELDKINKHFTGIIKQMPPVKSAVKRRLRDRKIYYIELIDISEDNKYILVRIGCEAGTYIRKLAHDMGELLGKGAHMAQLRRTKAGPFNEETNLVTLQNLKDAYWYWKNKEDESHIRNTIMPVEYAVNHLPKIWVLDTAVNSITQGASLKIPGVSKIEDDIKKGDVIAILTLKRELVSIAEAKMNSNEIIRKNKGIVSKPIQVFMKPNIYPRPE